MPSDDSMTHNDLLRDAADVWCSTYPRRVSSPIPEGWRQVSAYSVEEVVNNVAGASEKGQPGFVSVYSFPRGHTSDDGENIPHIDTLYFDIDRDRSEDDGTPSGWARDMSALLVRTRMIAQKLIDTGKDKYWRASLSGYKGVHLYLDFAPIPVENGNEAQFRAGMREYTDGMIDSLETATGLSLGEYIDVSSGKDLARLTRLPNTIHDKATERFGEPRYCVPVTIEELATITPESYIRLTKHPREVQDMTRRIPNEQAHAVITQMIRTATGSSVHRTSGSGGSYNVPQILKNYEETEANPDVSLELVTLHLRQKPCIGAYRERSDAFKKGQQSHIMEMNVIAALKNLRAPLSVMHEFFEDIDGYSERHTNDRIAAVIGAEMATADDDPDERYRGLNCETILSDAPAFCLGEQSGNGACRIWDREFAPQKSPASR